jgi:hypothetical protein
MHGLTSIQFPGSGPPDPPTGRPWYTSPALWMATAALAFIGFGVVPMATKPRPQWAELYDPRMPCEVIDWRVGEKLAVLDERWDHRSRTIVARMKQQRDIARQHCRAGHINDAMAIYGIVDRALTRYVQIGPTPDLPK